VSEAISPDEAGKEDTLWQRVRLTILTMKGEPVIDPISVADIAIESLSYDVIRLGCILELRQIAREVLRRLHMNGAKSSPSRGTEPIQPTLPGHDFSLLQERYPKAHSNPKDERGYVLKERMSEEDWEWNKANLQGEGEVRIRHARQLDLYGRAILGFGVAAARTRIV